MLAGYTRLQSASNLSGIVEARERLLGSAHVATGEAYYTLVCVSVCVCVCACLSVCVEGCMPLLCQPVPFRLLF